MLIFFVFLIFLKDTITIIVGLDDESSVSLTVKKSDNWEAVVSDFARKNSLDKKSQDTILDAVKENFSQTK